MKKQLTTATGITFLLLLISQSLFAQKMARTYAEGMIYMAQLNVPAFKNFLKSYSFYDSKEVIVAETTDKLGYNICIFKNDMTCLLTFNNKTLFKELSRDFAKLQNELYPSPQMEDSYIMTSYNGWKFFFNYDDYQIRCILKP